MSAQKSLHENKKEDSDVDKIECDITFYQLFERLLAVKTNNNQCSEVNNKSSTESYGAN